MKKLQQIMLNSKEKYDRVDTEFRARNNELRMIFYFKEINLSMT